MSTPHARRRLVLAGLASTSLALAVPGLRAQAAFPTRPIRVILGFPPGGSIDTVFRVIAASAEPILGQPVVIQNRPGAGGTVGTLAMTGAPPDGYTLGIVTMGVFRAPVMEDVPYDPLRDITYIVSLTHVPFGIVVRADSPFKTWAELRAHGKAHADKVNYGVAAGLGNSAHLLMEEMTAQDGVKWNPIPYKGSADTAQALMAGDVLFTVDGSGGFGPLVDAGRARLLAVASEERSPKWPDIPTTRELGYRMTIDSPWGLGGPKDMDPAVVRTIEQAFAKALQAQPVKDALARAGQGTRFKDHAEYTRFAQRAAGEERALLTKYGFAKKR